MAMMTTMRAMTALLLVALGACSSSSGSPQSDTSKTHTTPSEPTPAPTAGDDSGSSTTDGGAPEDAIDAGSGTTWTDLYRDLFGATSPASCAGSGACHGDANQAGARSSNGFVCTDKDGCRNSLLSADTGLVQASDSAAPEQGALIHTLRHRTTSGSVTGTMPKGGSYVFSRASVTRIETWIRNGAPND